MTPPNVQIDTEGDPEATIVTVDSANRPGTLIELVQVRCPPSRLAARVAAAASDISCRTSLRWHDEGAVASLRAALHHAWPQCEERPRLLGRRVVRGRVPTDE